MLAVITKALRIVGNSTGSMADLSEAMRAIAVNRIVPLVDGYLDWMRQPRLTPSWRQ